MHSYSSIRVVYSDESFDDFSAHSGWSLAKVEEYITDSCSWDEVISITLLYVS